EQYTDYIILLRLFYHHNLRSLTDDTVKKLYPKRVKTRVSRLEMLYRCSYQHFAKYCLNLEDRRTYTHDAPNIGQLFHEALKTITEWILEEGKDTTAITKNDCASNAKKAMSHLSLAENHHILSNTNRYKIIQR